MFFNLCESIADAPGVPDAHRLASRVVTAYGSPKVVRIPVHAFGENKSAPHGVDVRVEHRGSGDAIPIQPEFIDLKHAIRLTMIAKGARVEFRFCYGNSAKEIGINRIKGSGPDDGCVDRIGTVFGIGGKR